MKQLKKIRRETWMELLFLMGVFVMYFIWARIQPLGVSPDETMRYKIADYIYQNGKLPVGDDPAVRDELWGFSYAYYPVLSYMVSAVFMKLVSFITTSPFPLVMAARLANLCFGVLTAFFVVRIGKRLFESYRAWLFAFFICFMPGTVFVFSYVNCDGLAILSTSIIVYAWVCALQEGWSYRNCSVLSVGLGLCGLSYYNAYGFVLCSIAFFGISLWMEAKKAGDYRIFLKKGTFVCVFVLLLIGWWFIRNAILYDGDILARKASGLCAETYAVEELKPSKKVSPHSAGLTLLQMLNEGFANTTISWVELACRSFVGRFGHMSVAMQPWVENNLLDFIKAGCLLALFHPVQLFGLKEKGKLRLQGVFSWCMLAAALIPVGINIYYSYYQDYQAQGRYSLPMIIPLAYFMMTGYGNLLDGLVKKQIVRKILCGVVCALLVLITLWVFITIFWPVYRTEPFGIRALIGF